MAVVESAWAQHPGYRIDLVPFKGTARIWHGDLLLAESDAAIRVLETDHVERLYLPEADVRLGLLERVESHTVCPFKGEADYWSLPGDAPLEDVVWTYAEPFGEVAGLRGLLGVYHEKVRVELETRFSDGVALNRFPVWGDQDDLVRLLDAQERGPGRFEAPGYHERSRNVVEGGQLLGQAIVAASKAVPSQRVTSASMTFAKVATFDGPIELSVDVLRSGRTFSSVSVRAEQDGALVSPGLVLTAADAPDTINGAIPMPEVPGPSGSEPFDMGVSGRDLRIVDGAYDPDPDRVGPPVIYAWVRFRDSPDEEYLRRALVAQGSTHWTVAAAMAPHRGVGQADAHVTLSTGIVSAAIAFHDDAPLDEWFLYANSAVWSGRGLAQGEGKVFSHDGTLLASYIVQAMIRGFSAPPEQLGADRSMVL